MNLNLDEDIIDEIGEYIGFEMWNNRDKTKEYDFPSAREDHICLPGEKFVYGKIIYFKETPLLVFKYKGFYHGVKSLYILNLITIKPTKKSKIQKLLSTELCEKIQMIDIKK